MAAENDWKCERIFKDAGDGPINFPYEFLTQAKLALHQEELAAHNLQGVCRGRTDPYGRFDLEMNSRLALL